MSTCCKAPHDLLVAAMDSVESTDRQICVLEVDVLKGPVMSHG
jgi:hypothetical protein